MIKYFLYPSFRCLNQGFSSVWKNHDMFPAVFTLDSQNLHGEDSTVPLDFPSQVVIQGGLL